MTCGYRRVRDVRRAVSVGWFRAASALTVAALTLAAAVPAAARAVVAGPQRRVAAATVDTRLTLPGGRTYWLHVPAGPAVARPLIVGLHGAGGSGATFPAVSWLTDTADRHQAVVAYPDGVGGRWNAGPTCCDVAPGQVSTRDDVGFIRRVVADVAARTPVDADRVWAVGGSNGGALAWRLACEAYDLISAAVVISGWLDVACHVAVRVLHVHGDTDTAVPYWGGTGFEGRTFPPVGGFAGEAVRAGPGSEYVFVRCSCGHTWPTWNEHWWPWLADLR